MGQHPVGEFRYASADARQIWLRTTNAPGNYSTQKPATIFTLDDQGSARIALKIELFYLLGHWNHNNFVQFSNYCVKKTTISYLTRVPATVVVTSAHENFRNHLSSSSPQEHRLAFLVAHNWHRNLEAKYRF